MGWQRSAIQPWFLWSVKPLLHDLAIAVFSVIAYLFAFLSHRMEVCKNNQTFSNGGSCSCRKVNDFLRKGEYCQSHAGRGTCNEGKMFPTSISSSFVCVHERDRLNPAFSSVLVQPRASRAQPSFFLCRNGPWHSINKVDLGLTSLLSPSASLNWRLLSGCREAVEGTQAMQGGRGRRAGISCRFLSLPTDWSNSQGAIWFHTFAYPWSILQKFSSD